MSPNSDNRQSLSLSRDFATPYTSNPWAISNLAKYAPSWPVIPVITALDEDTFQY
jgi:hypothetical protein